MFHLVDDFEKAIAEFFGAPYAVSTDCCTHAIELCLRYKKIEHVYVPRHTYLSVPMTVKKIGSTLHWTDTEWVEYYSVTDTIYDAATMWRKNSYIPGSMMCLSFQFRKHLKLGRGGIILLDNKNDKDALIKLGYDGRHRNAPWAEQSLDSIGYHYYMTPETAQLGLEKLPEAIATPAETWSWKNYPDISSMLSSIL
jgi:dTDP-4-amino-4,6-dideoxygalactose transaminase